MTRWIAVGAACVALIAAGLAGCGGDDGPSGAATTATTSAATGTAAASDQEAVRSAAAARLRRVDDEFSAALARTGDDLNAALRDEDPLRISSAISIYATVIGEYDERVRTIVVPDDAADAHARLVAADEDTLSSATVVLRAIEEQNDEGALDALELFNEADAAGRDAAAELRGLLGLPGRP